MPWRQVDAMKERFQFVRDAWQRLVTFAGLRGKGVLPSVRRGSGGSSDGDTQKRDTIEHKTHRHDDSYGTVLQWRNSEERDGSEHDPRTRE